MLHSEPITSLHFTQLGNGTAKVTWYVATYQDGYYIGPYYIAGGFSSFTEKSTGTSLLITGNDKDIKIKYQVTAYSPTGVKGATYYSPTWRF